MKYILCILHRDKDLSTVKARNYKFSTTTAPECVKCPLSVKCTYDSGSRKYQSGSVEKLKY